MHTIEISHQDKTALYQQLLPQIECLIADEDNLIANLANVCAVLKSAFNWLWVGFYLVDNNHQQLVLGPFQGPLACTRIDYGRGVCGQAWAQAKTIVVEDVNNYPDHIACSSFSRSEIVVPLYDEVQRIIAVLDIDADIIAQFDGIDAQYLNKLCHLISPRITSPLEGY